MASDPGEIFELILQADARVKYVTPTKGDVHARQVADLLARALHDAEAIGHEGLVQQVKVRLADLEALLMAEDPAPPGSPSA